MNALASRIALDLPHVGLVLLREPNAYVQPAMYTITFQFSETTAFKFVEGTLIGSTGSTTPVIPAMFLVEDMVYTIQCPNADAGNILQFQAAEYRKRNPFVDLDVKFNGPPLVSQLYDIVMSATPIENIARPAGCYSPPFSQRRNPWVLWPSQAPTLNGQIRRTLQDDEIPYIVRWTLAGTSLIAPVDTCTKCSQMPLPEARAQCLAGFDEIAERLEKRGA